MLTNTIASLNSTYTRTNIDNIVGINTSYGSLDILITDIVSNIQLRLITLKNNFNGDASTGLRKWYLFWITLLIGKYQSSIISVLGLQFASNSNSQALDMSKSQLSILFGTNTEKYLLTPEISTVFKDDENVVNIIISALPCFSKYTLYRKEIVSTGALSNADYTLIVASEEVSESSLVIQDTSSYADDKLYSYRIKIQDMGSYMIDLYSSGSDQSLVYDDAISYSFTLDETRKVLTIPDHISSVGQYIYILNEGLFLIKSKTSSTVTVDRPIISSGYLFLTYGIFKS